MNIDLDVIRELQRQPERIRNVCVLAHVDHGKTTLSDHLIASNGLIHPRLAGELRFLDSREEEQVRGITMKSSSITLVHASTPADGGRPSRESILREGHLVNLIDSPGHIDFCSEVSTAVRLSDGALVVVDAVEGVCIQTHAVLRQAWQEKLEMCLVINKIDRLITELGLDPSEAHTRIKAVIAHVNMIVSSFHSEEFMSEADAVLAHEDTRTALAQHADAAGDEQEEPEDAFSPEKGNVIFGSAGDGWAFRLTEFAALYAAKLKCKPAALLRGLWGDYAFVPKTGRILGLKAAGPGASPMFEQLALKPLWRVYAAASGDDHAAALSALAASLGLKERVAARSLASADPKLALRALMQAWLPLAPAVLGAVAERLPSPDAAAPRRAARLLPPRALALRGAAPDEATRAALDAEEAAMTRCDASAKPVVYVSKMVSVPAASLPGFRGGAAAHDEVFLAFGRVFAGTVVAGEPLFVLPDTHNPADEDGRAGVASVAPAALYLMMGRGLETLESVPAGNVLAIAGLGQEISKSATLAWSPRARPLAPQLFQAAPIVRVAVEPVDPADVGRLAAGLALLSRADPMVRVEERASGEHVLCAAGEVHLETCVQDLEKRFARCPIIVSAPLVAFRESLADAACLQAAPTAVAPGAGAAAPAPEAANPLAPGVPAGGVVEAATPTGCCLIRVRALPLPAGLASALDKELETGGPEGVDAELGARLRRDAAPETGRVLARAWALGPRGRGPNLLLHSPTAALWAVPESSVIRGAKARLAVASGLAADEGEADDAQGVVEEVECAVQSPCPLGGPVLARQLGVADEEESVEAARNEDDEDASEAFGVDTRELARIRDSVTAGVQTGLDMATAAGPLCAEPMWGVGFEVEARLVSEAPGSLRLGEDVYGPLSGQVAAAARGAMHRAFLAALPRLTEAMYLAEMVTSSEGLSALYAVLGRRRARVLREELREGSDLFTVHAYLPAEASFGFLDELRRRSSGAASASLLLSHWERLAVDPFFVPTTEEEREEWGEEGQGVGAANLAKKLISATRRRKGLPVEEKVVESATKQRTRARKV